MGMAAQTAHGGTLSGDGSVRYRVNAVYENSKSFRHYADGTPFQTERVVLSAALDWDIDDATSFTFNSDCTDEQRPQDLGPYWRWSHMADPIHFGSFGGLTTKRIWFAFGIFLAGLSLSGGWLHLKRLQRDATGRTYWRGTVGASMAGMAKFLFRPHGPSDIQRKGRPKPPFSLYGW